MSAATRARLAELVADGPMDLAEANLLIAAEGSQALDMGLALGQVEALADAARAEGVVEVLRAAGFRGATDDYDDPRNSFLHEVLERRRGLPIALATLALAVAARVGAAMAGVGMPGHFVIADLEAPEPVYIDPFGGWRRLELADCAALVERTAGVPFRLEHVAPVSERHILGRTLRNLRGSYLRRRRLDAALWTVELGLIVDPDDGELVREAVVLLAGAGRYGEAEAVGSGFLAVRPADPAAPAIGDALAAVADLRRRMN
ncbi:transglutaminase-like domain-containing protein [Miltoncostaea marina]|uniref:transglutaminase family protein n=1 Tax=Miltoncostaea marina TaxID=2843215 RepID=UPI001C3CA56E|nr:transglutaminase-like domain-containing protein [Miltoncostaea marina]